MCGWIKIHRQIEQHWIYQDSFYFHRWIDILLAANYEPKKVVIKNQIFTCERGQTLMSVETWANRWKVNKSKAYRFLQMLEADGMIEIKNETVTTRLTICNYDSYQDTRNADETEMKRKRNADETETKTTKERKEDKEDKEIKNTDIPAREDFVEYGLSLVGNNKGYEFTLNAKFDSWVENKWRDGKGQKIKNWKTKLANTIPFLKPMAQPNELNVDHSHPLMQKLKGVDYTNQKL